MESFSRHLPWFRKSMVVAFSLLFFISVGIHAFKGCAPAGEAPRPPRTFSLAEFRPGWWETTDLIYFGIPARVVFQAPGHTGDPEALAQKIWNEFERIGRIFNPFDPDSETGRLNNRNTVGPVNVSSDLYDVLKLSGKLWEASDGAFDPTMLRIKQLWQNAVQAQQIPANRDISRAMARTGFDKVKLAVDRHEIHYEKKHIRFDFGGITKGYAVDRVVEILLAHGVESAMVSLAGEIRTFGKNKDAPWRIGIQHPVQMHAIWGVVSSETELSISTSGNYRQPLSIAGQDFYHIFSPKTGRPVSERVLGVTTLCASQKASNALLDGAATAIVVLGAAKGLEFAESIGIEALVIYRPRGGKIEALMTEGFEAHLQPPPPGD